VAADTLAVAWRAGGAALDDADRNPKGRNTPAERLLNRPARNGGVE